MEVKYREEQVITSPYVTQADKMAVSLRHLADRFLKMEPKKQCFTPEEMTEMYDRITEKVCRGCSRKSECLERKKAEQASEEQALQTKNDKGHCSEAAVSFFM